MKINFTILCLTILSIVELIITNAMFLSACLWVGYGFYKDLNN